MTSLREVSIKQLGDLLPASKGVDLKKLPARVTV